MLSFNTNMGAIELITHLLGSYSEITSQFHTRLLQGTEDILSSPSPPRPNPKPK